MDRGETIREHLFSLTTRGIKYDLDRMKLAVRRCGDPQNACACFHVAGTNGKGSVCAFLESALRQCGKKTGLFTSPHLVNFEERFMIDGAPVKEPQWIGVYHDLQRIIDEMRLTFFEAATLMAFEIFRRRGVEWAVFETGLGGRLDATNVVTPRVSVVSRIAMDHSEFLGNDLASIAREKLGIVKPRVPLVMALPSQGWMEDLAADRCKEAGSPCVFVSGNDARETVFDETGASFAWEGGRYRINLNGGYQVQNALLALHALETAGFGDRQSVAAGLEKARLPGRFQVAFFRGRTVVLDVGHNPDASEQFCQALGKRFGGQTACFVLGIMKDKDIAAMMPHYARVAKRLVLTRPNTERAAGPERLLKLVPGDFQGEKKVATDVAAALEAAFGGSEKVVCVAGSFFTVGEAMRYMHIDPYGR